MSRRAKHDARPHPWRRGFLLAGWLLCAAIVCVRAVQIQVLEGSQWQALADGQHEADEVLSAPRGTILDREGIPLSVARERVMVHIAPDEVRDPDALVGTLTDVLGVSTVRASRLVTTGAGWNAAGLFAPAVQDRLRGKSGVYVDRVFERYYPHGDLARGVLGVVLEGEGRGGVERIFDEWLSGVPGRQVVPRDNVGNPIPGEQVTVERARAGGEIVLTLDMDLQEIAQEALLAAIDEHEALGGDILITDPRTGEILALFSTQDGHVGALSAVNTPFEPGSTLKPFTIAGLLKNGLASLEDTVDAGDGTWEQFGRTLNDTHTEGLMTIRDALRESSNVGVAKAALPMSPGVQYENLRDFGFGALTGLELPGEVGGTLRRPDRWTDQSPASLAIGYEISVTPLQMAMAYGALANGGLLMRPRLVRELRAPDGSAVETFEPQVIRRVVDEQSARSIGRALVDVVEDGTGRSARLGSFRVAGKSGTARISSGGRYRTGDYSASFVGYFPADDPQLVVFVKLDRPRGNQYYGGAVAAPVTRTTMEAALAASPKHLNRGALVAAARDDHRIVSSGFTPIFIDNSPLEPALPPVFASDGQVTVPDLTGLPTRIAIRHLHRLGLRVAQEGVGDIIQSAPRSGTLVSPGDTIRLRYRGQTNE